MFQIPGYIPGCIPCKFYARNTSTIGLDHAIAPIYLILETIKCMSK
jgi:hypothetical protein